MFGRLWLIVPVLTLMALPGCATLQQLTGLRPVTFAFTGVSDVRIAGIGLQSDSRFTALTVADAGRLANAIITKEVPLEMIVHVGATNPRENNVSARLADLDWTLFIEDRRTLTGGLAAPLTIAVGGTTDIPLTVQFDLLQLGSGGAQDLFDLALAVAGYGTLKKDLRLELVPTIETSMGPMSYPVPITVRRN